MLSLTRKTDYALVALAGLASDPPAAVSAHDLAERWRLPLPALRNILKDLARAGLLTSTQGINGGYRLARPAERITLAEVVDAIEGPVRLAVCCATPEGEQAEACRLEDSCRVKGAVRQVHQRLVEYFSRVTLADLLAEQAPAIDDQPTLSPLTASAADPRERDAITERPTT